MPIRAGELDRRVLVQRAAYTVDALNARVQAGWTVLADVAAKRTPVSASLATQGAQPGRISTHRFLVRWSAVLADLTSADQIRCEGLTYGVDEVEEMGRRVGLMIWGTARPDLA